MEQRRVLTECPACRIAFGVHAKLHPATEHKVPDVLIALGRIEGSVKDWPFTDDEFVKLSEGNGAPEWVALVRELLSIRHLIEETARRSNEN